ncbi:MAG: MOP flippase family protein [Syntrophorhabdales bacterium]|jgi:O-antigen/teichoic acid export membrane protein
MTPSNLRQQTIHALSWSFLEAAGLQGVRFVTGIILARLLFPEQFGLIGMLWIFIAVAQTFLDSGFGAALIQRREVTPADTCSIFYFNIGVGLAAAGLLCLVAPWIAGFYSQPILTPLIRALSLTIVINSFGLIQGTILSKQINFKMQTKVSLIASALAGTIGVSLAYAGFGVWALVVQQISGAVFQTAFLWLFNTWRPALIFSFKSLREMFKFGSRLLGSGLLNQVFDNIYLLVIGKLFSATDLGFFTRAKTFQELPSNTLSGMVARVTFPVFSTIQDDPTRLKKGLKKALTTLVLVNFPMMVGLAVIARPLVLVLLTEKWAPSIPYLQVLSFVGLLYPLHVINLNLLQALGRSELFLRLEIIKKVLIVINIAVTWRWGISAMICGMIVTSIISYYLNSYYTGVLIGYPIREQLRDLSPYLISSAIMGIMVYAVGSLPLVSHWLMLLAQITLGIVVYLCLCRLFRLAAFMEIWQTGWTKMPFFKVETAG